MRKIHIHLEDNGKYLIEINKQTFYLEFHQLETLGLSTQLLDKLKKSILKARDNNLDNFTLDY